jgi:hypothetical protein
MIIIIISIFSSFSGDVSLCFACPPSQSPSKEACCHPGTPGQGNWRRRASSSVCWGLTYPEHHEEPAGAERDSPGDVGSGPPQPRQRRGEMGLQSWRWRQRIARFAGVGNCSEGRELEVGGKGLDPQATRRRTRGHPVSHGLPLISPIPQNPAARRGVALVWRLPSEFGQSRCRLLGARGPGSTSERVLRKAR